MISYHSIKDLGNSERLKLAQAHLDHERNEDALLIINSVLDDDPDNDLALFMASQILVDSDKIGLASALLRRAVYLNPSKAEIWTALGRTLPDDTQEEEAVACMETALHIDPNYTPALINLAAIHVHSGRPDEAVDLCNKALSIDPESESGHDIRSMAYLMRGDWTKGWQDNQWALGRKFRHEIMFGDEGRWDGSKGQAVIVYGEQGLGDEILYASCLPDAIRDCKKVIVECDPKLEGLFRRSFPKAAVYGTRRLEADWPNHHKWDARCAIGTLPMFYRNDDNDFPGIPYLKADPVRRRQWRVTLDDLGQRPKIGIAWNGGGKFTGRQKRRIPLESFKPLFEIGEVISLEYEEPDLEGLPIHHWSHATLTNDYDDTAALVAELDFVVTTTTTIVHLCGALGVECHTLVESKPNYRFYKNVWHDSVITYPYQGDWKPVIEEIARAYQRRIQGTDHKEACG